MATIRKRKTQWEAQVRMVGRPSECRRFSTYPEAREWSRNVESHRKIEPISPILSFSHKEITLGEVFDRYQNLISPEKRGADREQFKLNLLRRQDKANKPLRSIARAYVARFQDR